MSPRNKWKSPPEDVGKNLPVDTNPTLEGATPPPKCKKNKSVPDNAQKEIWYGASLDGPLCYTHNPSLGISSGTV